MPLPEPGAPKMMMFFIKVLFCELMFLCEEFRLVDEGEDVARVAPFAVVVESVADDEVVRDFEAAIVNGDFPFRASGFTSREQTEMEAGLWVCSVSIM